MAGLENTKKVVESSGKQGSDQEVEQLWQLYFKDPSQWWELRKDKLHLRSPDFRHKTTKEALWIDGSDTPKWVKEAFEKKSEEANS